MEKREKLSRSSIILFAFFLMWNLLIFIGPMAIPTGSIQDLSGYTIISENEEVINDIPFPWNIPYTCGDRMCHEKAERSFFINSNEMSFCARCTAIWLGLAIALGFSIFFKIKIEDRYLLLLILIGIVPLAIDGLGQLVGFWESTNLIRLATGLLMGSTCGLSIGIITDEISDIRQFKKTK